MDQFLFDQISIFHFKFFIFDQNVHFQNFDFWSLTNLKIDHNSLPSDTTNYFQL